MGLGASGRARRFASESQCGAPSWTTQQGYRAGFPNRLTMTAPAGRGLRKRDPTPERRRPPEMGRAEEHSDADPRRSKSGKGRRSREPPARKTGTTRG